MKKVQKGAYGYIDAQRKIETIKTIVLFGLAAAIFLVGYLSTGTKKNLFTVVAVVSVLPAAKQMATTVLFYRCSSGSKEVFEKISKVSGQVTSVYDLVITSYDKILEIFHIAIAGKTIIGYSEKEKIDEKFAAYFIKQMLEQNGYKGTSVKIFKNQETYLARLEEMQENLGGEEKKELEEAMAGVIKAISI
ncbi:MAG: hypothetical protein IJA36_12455 [Lachnospiraceae bacterium]|nr:hypothetical protein [Lachnospiraceae bacterium]